LKEANEAEKVHQEQAKKSRMDDLFDNACDWDATACIATSNANFVSQDCRTCALHVHLCMATTHLRSESQAQTQAISIDDCMDEVAEAANDACGECKSMASHDAYKVRSGLMDPP